jgi:hypothetical protein
MASITFVSIAEIVTKKIAGTSVVGMDAANVSGGDKHGIEPMLVGPARDRVSIV